MINALNFSDMGYDVTGPQVHADGEIWSATNFRIRTLLNDKYDDDFPSDDEDLQYACANGELPPYACPGNRRWFQLYYDAMLLMPTNPSMLQARDAILTADLMRFGGANQREIWLGFARSGYGQGAASSNTTADTDTDPTPSFKSPMHDNAVIRFRARGKDGTTINNARIYVGHYEARVSPIADTNPATTGENLDDVADFAPGTYELVAHAPGYGHLRGRKQFYSGEDSIIEFRFPTNHAAAAKGATATGDGTAPGNLIDDTERHAVDRRGHDHRRQPLGGRQEGDDRPRRHGAGADRPPPGQRTSRGWAEPLHGAAPVRGVGVQQRRPSGSDDATARWTAGTTGCTRALRTPSRRIRRGPSHRT